MFSAFREALTHRKPYFLRGFSPPRSIFTAETMFRLPSFRSACITCFIKGPTPQPSVQHTEDRHEAMEFGLHGYHVSGQCPRAAQSRNPTCAVKRLYPSPPPERQCSPARRAPIEHEPNSCRRSQDRVESMSRHGMSNQCQDVGCRIHVGTWGIRPVRPCAGTL